MGEPEHLQMLTPEHCRADWQMRYHADGAILALAGNIDFQKIRDAAENEPWIEIPREDHALAAFKIAREFEDRSFDFSKEPAAR